MTYIIRHAIKDRATPRCFAGLGLSHGINGWQAYKAKDALQAYYAMRSLSEVRDAQGYTRHIESKRGMNGETFHTWRFIKDGYAEVIEFRTR